MKILLTDLDNIFCGEGGLYDDALPFLRAAHERFFIILLTNNSFADTKARVSSLGLSEYVDFIISASEYEMPKPDPRMINVLLALLNTEGKKFDKDDIIFLGDRPETDIAFGNKAGLRTIRMLRGKFSAEKPESPEEEVKLEIKGLKEFASMIGVNMREEIPEKVPEDAPAAEGPRHPDLSEEFAGEAEEQVFEEREVFVEPAPAAVKKPAASRTKRKKTRPAKKRKVASRARKKPQKRRQTSRKAKAASKARPKKRKRAPSGAAHEKKKKRFWFFEI